MTKTNTPQQPKHNVWICWVSLIEASKQTKVHIHVCVASTMQYLTQHHTLVGSVLIGLSVVNSYRETPGPIPNPEAKPVHADGTATGRLWESKSPPTPNNKKITTYCYW